MVESILPVSSLLGVDPGGVPFLWRNSPSYGSNPDLNSFVDLGSCGGSLYAKDRISEGSNAR